MRGNMKPHYRSTITKIKDDWASDGKDVEVEASRKKLTTADAVDLLKVLPIKHRHLVEDERISAPLSSKNKFPKRVKFKSYHASGPEDTGCESNQEFAERVAEELRDRNVDAQSFASILGTRSGVMVSVPTTQQ